MEEKKLEKTQMEDWREWRYQTEEKVATMADDRPPSPVVAQLMQDDREEPPEGLSPAQRANWFAARRMARMRERRRHEDPEGFLRANRDAVAASRARARANQHRVRRPLPPRMTLRLPTVAEPPTDEDRSGLVLRLPGPAPAPPAAGGGSGLLLRLPQPSASSILGGGGAFGDRNLHAADDDIAASTALLALKQASPHRKTTAGPPWKVRRQRGMGWGLQATRFIPAGTNLGSYAGGAGGEIIRDADEMQRRLDAGNIYLMRVGDADVWLDPSNETDERFMLHLINHRCGCFANCHFVPTGPESIDCITVEDIEVGTWLSVDYGYVWDEEMRNDAHLGWYVNLPRCSSCGHRSQADRNQRGGK